MKRLRERLLTISDLKYDQVAVLVNPGVFEGRITEKTDGRAFAIGYDQNGFYTQTSNSDRIYSGEDYLKSSMEKFGCVTFLTRCMCNSHELFSLNERLVEYLKPNRHIKGELFYVPCTFFEDGYSVNYIKYDIDLFRTFVIHTKLPENKDHDFELIKAFSNSDFKFDTDEVGYFSINLEEEQKAFDLLDRELVYSRRHSEQERKSIEKSKLVNTQNSIKSKLEEMSKTLTPKWGNEAEGWVFHPNNSTQPRIKVFSDVFLERRKDIAWVEK